MLDRAVRNVKSRRVQCDEIWSFCTMEEKTAQKKGEDRPDGVGDVWTWTAIDADTKLIVAWLVGGRRRVRRRHRLRDAGEGLRPWSCGRRPLQPSRVHAHDRRADLWHACT